MKKQKLLIFSLLLLTFSSFGQAPRGFYAFAGYSQTSLKSSDMNTKSKPGFALGVNFNMGYHENYNFQFEALYRQNNISAKYVDYTLAQAKEADLKYSTAEIGFYVNYYVIKPDEGSIFLGPQAGVFATFADNLSSSGEDPNGQNYLPHLINNSNLSDFGKVNYGVGLGLTGGYNKFRFDMRYSLGLSDPMKNVLTNSYDGNNQYTGPTLSGKLNTLTFGISYLFFSSQARK